MANQSKLKAWVRVDGTGTVVLAGPIFSLKKPKDGKWRELNANLCCNTINPSSSTTTTTTHSTGGAYLLMVWSPNQGNLSGPCDTNNSYRHAVYVRTSQWIANGQKLASGMNVYSDSGLTQPFDGIINPSSTPVAYSQFFRVLGGTIGNQNEYCGLNNGSSVTINSYNSGNPCGSGISTIMFGTNDFNNSPYLALDSGNFQQLGFSLGDTIWIKPSYSSFSRMFNIVGDSLAMFQSIEVPCTTTTTTTSPVLSPINVYTQAGSSTSQLCPPGSEGTSGVSTMYCATPIVSVGSVVYYDPNGSNPVGGGGFYHKQVGQSLVWTCPYYNGVVSEIPC